MGSVLETSEDTPELGLDGLYVTVEVNVVWIVVVVVVAVRVVLASDVLVS